MLVRVLSHVSSVVWVNLLSGCQQGGRRDRRHRVDPQGPLQLKNIPKLFVFPARSPPCPRLFSSHLDCSTLLGRAVLSVNSSSSFLQACFLFRFVFLLFFYFSSFFPYVSTCSRFCFHLGNFCVRTKVPNPRFAGGHDRKRSQDLGRFTVLSRKWDITV